jgi:hypothetical protein
MKLARLNEKIHRIQNFDRLQVNEAKVSVLMEEVEESDIADLKSTISAFKSAVKNTKTEVQNLTTQIASNENVGKPAAETLERYLDAHESALDELEASAASVSFESGFGASLKATQITIPGLVAAATDAIGVLEAFLRGFEKFKSIVNSSLVPLAKEDDKSLSDQQSTNSKIPNLEKMVAKATEIYDDAKGGGILAGAKSLLSMVLNPIDTAKKAIQTSSDEVEKVVAKFPKFEAKALGKATAELMINVKVSALKGLKPVATPPTSNLQDPAKAARSEVTGGGQEIKDDFKPGATAEVDGKKYKKGKKSGWFDVSAAGNPNKIRASAEEIKKNSKLLQAIIKSAKDAAGGGGSSEGAEQKVQKIKDQLKGVPPAELAKALKAAGLIPESKMLLGGLGFGAPKKNLTDHNEQLIDRWAKLAGIK